MGNPFDKVKAETARIIKDPSYAPGNSSSSQKINEQAIVSIYDEANSLSSGIDNIRTADIKSIFEAETKAQAREIQRKQTIAAVTVLASSLPAITNGLTSVLSITRSMNGSKVSPNQLQQYQAKLQQVQQEIEQFNTQINEATNSKKSAEATQKEQEAEATRQQKAVDDYNAEEDTLTANISAKETEIAAAEQELETAENMKTTKQVTDNGITKTVEDPAKKTEKEKAVADAKAKIEKLKNEKEELEAKKAKATENKKTAQQALSAARTAQEEAEAQAKQSQATINALTPKRDKLKTLAKQLETEIKRLGGEMPVKPEKKDGDGHKTT